MDDKLTDAQVREAAAFTDEQCTEHIWGPIYRVTRTLAREVLALREARDGHNSPTTNIVYSSDEES